MIWSEYIKNRIRAKSGWYYLNQNIADQAVSFKDGLYIYTDRYRWDENRYKIGETSTGRGKKRVFEQGADQSEDLYIVGFIPLKIDNRGYDSTIHKVLKTHFGCRIIKKESASTYTEWVEYPYDSDPVSTTILAIQKEKNDVKAGRVDLMLTLTQMKSLEKALDLYEDDKVLLAELCPRFGKTVWSMALFDHSDKKVMVVSSYVHSVFNSFRSDCARFTQFENLAIARDAKEIQQNEKRGIRSIVLVPLTDKFDRWVEKYGWLADIKDKFVFVDEADYGAHKPAQVKKVKYLLETS
jgi:hypothetical protein